MSTTGAKDVSPAELDAGLTKWKAGCSNPLIVAAVNLLQEHRRWLENEKFRGRCVYVWSDAYPDSGGMMSVQWVRVREHLDGGFRDMSSADLGVLEFACSLAEDRFGWSAMGATCTAMVLRAVTAVLAGGASTTDDERRGEA